MLTFKHIQFPDPLDYGSEGLIAAGGNLSYDMLVSAYTQGLFPWFNPGEQILWWSPNPRMVLYPWDLKVSKSLKQSMQNKNYKVFFDRDFKKTINCCSTIHREGQASSWITKEIIAAYNKLHKDGIAHSVEVYDGNALIGGLYGLGIGKAFFGESMFHKKRDASKIALYHLCEKLIALDFDFIDVQQSTSHLASLGAVELAREKFLGMLSVSVTKQGHYYNWS